MNTAERVMDVQRTTLATWSDLSVTAMTGAERWFTLQIDVMRSLFDGGLDQTRQMGDLDNPQSLLTAMSSMSKPIMDTVMSYHTESFQILQTTGLELSNILSRHWQGQTDQIKPLAAGSTDHSSASTPPPFPLNTALQSIFESAFKSPFVPDFTGPFGRVFGSPLAERETRSTEASKIGKPSHKIHPKNGIADPQSPDRDSHPRATGASRRASPDQT